MKKNSVIVTFTTIYIIFFLFISCKKEESKPVVNVTVTTNEVVVTTMFDALSGGNINSDSNIPVDFVGVCWSESKTPTLNDFYSTDTLQDDGTFASKMTQLKPKTTYFVRAYARIGLDVYYGNEREFAMPFGDLPTLTTDSIIDILHNEAVGGGNVTANGSLPVTAKGICWNTSPNPTIDDQHCVNGLGIGEFTQTITDLKGSTTYYVRAYATNSYGTAYGNEVCFTTLAENNGHPYIDLGLPSGTMWAYYNIGASHPEDYGDFYAWAETATKEEYADWNYKYYDTVVGWLKYTCRFQWSWGYVIPCAVYDNLKVLEPEDDAAVLHLGNGWHVPTLQEAKELIKYCTLKAEIFHDVYGYRLIGPNGNSMFMPDNKFVFDGYWVNEIYGQHFISAYSIFYRSNSYEIELDGLTDRMRGNPIRPTFKP